MSYIHIALFIHPISGPLFGRAEGPVVTDHLSAHQEQFDADHWDALVAGGDPPWRHYHVGGLNLRVGWLCLEKSPLINMDLYMDLYGLYYLYMIYVSCILYGISKIYLFSIWSILSIVSIWYVLSMLSTLDSLSILSVLSILSNYIISVLSIIYVIDIIDIRYTAKEKNLDNLRNLDAQFGWSIFEILPKKELDKVLKFSHHHEFSKKTTWQEAERSFSKSLSILGIKHLPARKSWSNGVVYLGNQFWIINKIPWFSIGYQIKLCYPLVN